MALPETEPNKDERHRYMREYDRERRKRANRLFHWATDMPPEEEEMDVRVSRRGVSWPELAVIGATLVGLTFAWQGLPSLELPTPASPPQSASPADSEYEVRFYDKDGNLIEVPRKGTE